MSRLKQNKVGKKVQRIEMLTKEEHENLNDCLKRLEKEARDTCKIKGKKK